MGDGFVRELTLPRLEAVISPATRRCPPSPARSWRRAPARAAGWRRCGASPLLHDLVAAHGVLPDAGGDAAPIGEVACVEVVATAAEAGSGLVVADAEIGDALAEGAEWRGMARKARNGAEGLRPIRVALLLVNVAVASVHRGRVQWSPPSQTHAADSGSPEPCAPAPPPTLRLRSAIAKPRPAGKAPPVSRVAAR